MEITRVVVRLVDMNKVQAIASITFDDEFVVHNLRVVDGDKGLFVAMPSRKLPNGEYRDVAHPINTEMRERIQSAVLDEYKQVKEGKAKSPSEKKDSAKEPSGEEEKQGEKEKQESDSGEKQEG
ncbi:septation regulator SpoVG [Candidatus Oleimmundimicrobium sp.]|uniref:septation regulator SpoVG n=1 Tax=Candidatus Oleimmundimicrobium sp. TaxID=3060597 RepID=UPI00271D18E3|nr:septation regulator SpoVG [Candidatus Oleimmundimicrobium sp.]MDO8886302.1 septation regulator SpoVG [Candidatus Oleimmundimicrobium sp.]